MKVTTFFISLHPEKVHTEIRTDDRVPGEVGVCN